MSDLLLAAGAILRDQGILDLREKSKEDIWRGVHDWTRDQRSQLSCGDAVMILSDGIEDPLDEGIDRVDSDREDGAAPAPPGGGSVVAASSWSSHSDPDIIKEPLRLEKAQHKIFFLGYLNTDLDWTTGSIWDQDSTTTSDPGCGSTPSCSA